MALARLNVPGIVLYGGSIAPGQFHGHEVTIQDVFEAVGAHASGRMNDSDFKLMEEWRARERARVGPVHRQHDGDRHRNPRHRRARQRSVPATDPEKARVGHAVGEQIVKLVKLGRRPRDIITKKAIENAIAVVAATGARQCRAPPPRDRERTEVELALPDFDRISARTHR